MSIAICMLAFAALLWVVRWRGASLGLSTAYMLLTLINYVPGAYAHRVARGALGDDTYTQIGIGYAALGATCFVIGIILATLFLKPPEIRTFAHRRAFAMFCLAGGWLMIYGLTPLKSLPSLGAAIEKGGAIWTLGVLLALRYHLQNGALRRTLPWVAALAVYPAAMLVLGGFLSYGAAAIITACSVLAVSTRSNWRVAIGSVAAVFVAMTLFVNYYSNRDDMRAVVWSQSTISQRISANTRMFTNFHLFSAKDPAQLNALDQRLNQNVYIGIAQKRMDGGQVHHLNGRSITDALLSVVPRAIWPSKPVYGGSPALVSEMTGLRLNPDTSFGVGQVMEFQINFGAPGVAVGFILMGLLVGFLDIKAAVAEAKGDLGSTILFFLPGAALLQPIGSLVELSGGAAAALFAALLWRLLWRRLSPRLSTPRSAPAPGRGAPRRALP